MSSCEARRWEVSIGATSAVGAWETSRSQVKLCRPGGQCAAFMVGVQGCPEALAGSNREFFGISNDGVWRRAPENGG
jgi:hypothetical protein